MNGFGHTVTAATAEAGTDFRRVVSDSGNEEIVTLKMLQEDAAFGDLIIVDK